MDWVAGMVFVFGGVELMIHSICRWECVLTSRYTTTGRSGLGLLRDDEGRAPQRRHRRDSTTRTAGADSGSDQVGPDDLLTLSLRDYGPADPRGVFHPGKVICRSIRYPSGATPFHPTPGFEAASFKARS